MSPVDGRTWDQHSDPRLSSREPTEVGEQPASLLLVMPQPLAQPINCPNSMVLKAALRHRKVQPCCRSALLLIFTFSAESQERLVTECSWVALHQKEHAPETAGGLSLVGPGELLMKVRSPLRNAWKGIQGDFPGATCTSWAMALGRLGTSPLHPDLSLPGEFLSRQFLPS